MARKGLSKLFYNLTFMIDLAGIGLAIIAAYYMRFSGWPIPLLHEAPSLTVYLKVLPIIGLVFLICNQYAGLYVQRRGISSVDELSRITKSSIVTFLILIGLTYFYSRVTYSRLVLIYGWFLTIVLVTLFRSMLHRLQVSLRRKGIGISKVALVGLTGAAKKVADQFKQHPGLGYRLMGYISETKVEDSQWESAPILGALDKAKAIIEQQQLDELIFALPSSAHEKMQSALLEVSETGINLKILSDLFGIITNPLSIEDIYGVPIFALKQSPLTTLSARFRKRLFDLIVTIPALVLLSPLLLLIAGIVKLTSKGPVFFKQERIGRGNKPFLVMKFRSMGVDAEKHSGPVWASKDDDRTTWIGSVLRKTSLDELPQLFNIMKGEMSLVGPRPERGHFVEQFKEKIPNYLDRHKVKAGLTGWAQVHGLRGNTPIEDRTTYDLWYVENWSLILDIKIIIRTALEFLHHSDAY